MGPQPWCLMHPFSVRRARWSAVLTGDHYSSILLDARPPRRGPFLAAVTPCVCLLLQRSGTFMSCGQARARPTLREPAQTGSRGHGACQLVCGSLGGWKAISDGGPRDTRLLHQVGDQCLPNHRGPKARGDPRHDTRGTYHYDVPATHPGRHIAPHCARVWTPRAGLLPAAAPDSAHEVPYQPAWEPTRVC